MLSAAGVAHAHCASRAALAEMAVLTVSDVAGASRRFDARARAVGGAIGAGHAVLVGPLGRAAGGEGARGGQCGRPCSQLRDFGFQLSEGAEEDEGETGTRVGAGRRTRGALAGRKSAAGKDCRAFE